MTTRVMSSFLRAGRGDDKTLKYSMIIPYDDVLKTNNKNLKIMHFNTFYV